MTDEPEVWLPIHEHLSPIPGLMVRILPEMPLDISDHMFETEWELDDFMSRILRTEDRLLARAAYAGKQPSAFLRISDLTC